MCGQVSENADLTLMSLDNDGTYNGISEEILSKIFLITFFFSSGMNKKSAQATHPDVKKN